MSVAKMLFRRDDDDKEDLDVNDSSMRNLLVTLVVLIAFGIVLGGSLFAINRHRKQRKDNGTLPTYEETTRNRSRLTIQTSRDSTFVFSEKQNLIDNSSPMPLSPENVPEIRITFPEEEGVDGRRVSGRVMVVQVGEAGVGYIRPMDQDRQLPSYNQTNANEQYTSLDLERIGGLKETR